MQPVKALLINPGYEYIEIGLLSHQTVLESCAVHKHIASRDLITKIDELLVNNNTNLNGINFIGVNTGPGPFTTLRVAIATINGLAYSSRIPLIGIDGLDAWILQEKPACTSEYLAIVLNAYSEDVYYAIYNNGNGQIIKGCEQIDAFRNRLETIAKDCTHKPFITLVGNGVKNLNELTALGATVNADNATDHCSLQSIARLSYQAWTNGDKKTMLLPQYMKATSVVIRK